MQNDFDLYLDYLSEIHYCCNELPFEHWHDFKEYIEKNNLDPSIFTYEDYENRQDF